MSYEAVSAVTVRFKGGAHIADAAYDLQRLANTTGVGAQGRFCGTEIAAAPGGNWRDIVAGFFQERDE